MALIAPSLPVMGLVFFGPVWQDPLARALNVSTDQVKAWAQDPATIPQDLEDELARIGKTRMVEIQVMLSQMQKTGLSRTIEDEEE